MSETSGGIVPLNWPALVAEAIRRRKAERMTQKEHAALAGVSIPTMIAFDRAELTLSLAKATDILRVVGLVEEPAAAEGAQEIFVRDAFARWRDLTGDLPITSAGRFPHGWYRIDYALEGDIRPLDLPRFRDVLGRAVMRDLRWPFFSAPRRDKLPPYEIAGDIECWLPPGDEGDLLYDAGYCEFWRASPAGRMLLIRGYQEDAQETIPAGTIFDTTLPIWRIGEALLHAAKLANLIARDPAETKVHLRVLYTGLGGRTLRAWAAPESVDYLGGGRTRSDEAMLEGVAPIADIESNLGAYVYPMVSSLFERFGVAGISSAFVATELERMRPRHPLKRWRSTQGR